jgi:hypothetical protein
MKSFNMEPSDLKKLIADYIENGFLENIIDMFKHDESLYYLIGDLVKDERLNVRIGVSALIETLAIPSIISLLKDQNPTIRSDTAYLLGIIRNKDAIPISEN